MLCSQFEQVLEQEPDGALSQAAELHLEDCSDCRLLWNDIQVIRQAGNELGAEESALPRRVWITLRTQLESEGLVRHAKPAGWLAEWFGRTPRLALAGASMALLSVAITLVNYNRGRPPVTVPATQQSGVSSAPSVAGIGNVLDGDLKRVMASLPNSDVALTRSFQQNLRIVDNLIAMCERSVREQPDDPVAREYLYGAYQQKAVLLATAMDRSTLEDR